MKLIAPIVLAAASNAFDIDMEHEDQLVRVRRNTLRDIMADRLSNNALVASPSANDNDNENDVNNSGEFECTLRDLDGFTFYYDDIDNEADCRAEKDLIFTVECETELCGDDAAWPCTPDGIAACVQGQYLAGRNGNGRKLGVRYTRWKAVAKIIAHQVAKPTLSKKDVIKKMLNYGCHCFPGSKKDRSIGGKGPAVDEIDGTCRSQYQCHKCAEMNQGCNPDETAYAVQFKGKKGQIGGKQIICRDEEGTCGRSICECDKRMAENLDKIWFKPNMHNTFYWYDRKNLKKARKDPSHKVFDYEATCFTGQTSPQPDACCGNFPDVIPYNVGSKSCCVVTEGPKLINPMTHTCCAGGIIAQAGSC